MVKVTLKKSLPGFAYDKLKSWYWRENLPELAMMFGTDKWGIHKYAIHYQTHLMHLRKRAINLLEIGVGGQDDPKKGGASLRMWKAFFPKANIYAIDIFDKSAIEEPRIKIFKGSQADPEFLLWVAQKIGRLDVIIDDGSHINEHVLASFHVLFPLLAENGIYAIEDLQTSYWPSFAGSENTNDVNTSMGYIKSLVDGLNWEEFHERKNGPYDEMITQIHFFHNLAIINKGRNVEGSNKSPGHIARF
jgi:hypothetical protein